MLRIWFLNLHGGAHGRFRMLTLSRNSRCSLGADRPADPRLSGESERWPSAVANAQSSRRYFVCFGDRLPVEGNASTVRFRQCYPCLLSRVGGSGRVSGIVGTCVERV